MPHAIWNGSISLGLVNIPIAVYPAVRERLIAFNNLHASCHRRLENKRWCPYHNMEVPWNEVVKGYKISKDKYVVVDQKELRAVQLKSTRAIDIVNFIDVSEIDPLLVENNYYIVPQQGGERAYALFREVLETACKAAVGKVVMRTKERVVAIRHYQKGMVMTVLHYKDEVTPMEDLEALKNLAAPKESELKLARILVDQLSGDLDMGEFKDEYEGALVKIIKKKLAGKEVEEAPEIKPVPTKDLMEALKVSVQSAKKKK
jgi:DNA end-binding protein Ku